MTKKGYYDIIDYPLEFLTPLLFSRDVWRSESDVGGRGVGY